MKSQTFVGGLTGERGRTLRLEQRMCRRVIVVIIGGESLMGVIVIIVSGCNLLVPLDDLLPSILLDHVSKLDYELALFILLA